MTLAWSPFRRGPALPGQRVHRRPDAELGVLALRPLRIRLLRPPRRRRLPPLRRHMLLRQGQYSNNVHMGGG